MYFRATLKSDGCQSKRFSRIFLTNCLQNGRCAAGSSLEAVNTAFAEMVADWDIENILDLNMKSKKSRNAFALFVALSQETLGTRADVR